MKRILIRTAISLVIVMILMGLVGLILPSSFTVEAKATVQAPADDIYQLLITPRSWVDWSPWNKQAMPELESTYKGPESGVGVALGVDFETEVAETYLMQPFLHLL